MSASPIKESEMPPFTDARGGVQTAAEDASLEHAITLLVGPEVHCFADNLERIARSITFH